MHGSCHNGNDDEPNGSKAVTLLLRLANMALAITSAVIMATASSCTINRNDDATTSITVSFKDYQPFSYMVGANIAAAILEAIGIYLQLTGKEEDEEEPKKLPEILLVLIDVAVQGLLYFATGAVFAGEVSYEHEIKTCIRGSGRFCDQVKRSKFLSLGASVSSSLAAAAKDVPLPFSVWPFSSSSSDC